MALQKVFGRTDEGSIALYICYDGGDCYIRSSLHIPEYTGNVKFMTARVYCNKTAVKYKCAIYQYMIYNIYPHCWSLLAETEENGNTAAWTKQLITFPFKKPFRVVAGRTYMLSIWGNGLGNAVTYTDAHPDLVYGGAGLILAYGEWPDPITTDWSDDRVNSVYATYEPMSSLQISLGADKKPTRTVPAPDVTYWGTGKPGSFGGYTGLSKMRLGLHRHPYSRIR